MLEVKMVEWMAALMVVLMVRKMVEQKVGHLV